MKKEKIHLEVIKHTYELFDKSKDMLNEIMETLEMKEDFKKKIWWDLYCIERALDEEKT